jgi:soluble lytic murein transglycosylase-like protein
MQRGRQRSRQLPRTASSASFLSWGPSGSLWLGACLGAAVLSAFFPESQNVREVWARSEGPAGPIQLPLGEVMKRRLDGLETDRPREALAEARRFAAFRGRSGGRGGAGVRMTRKERKAYEAFCQKSEDPYCSFIADAQTKKSGQRLRSLLSQLLSRDPVQRGLAAGAPPSAVSSAPSPGDEDDAPATGGNAAPPSVVYFGSTLGPAQETQHSRIVGWIAQGNLPSLGQAKPRALSKALRSFPDWASLAPLAQQALQSASCPAPSVLSAIASRAEELFPDAKARIAAVELYRRASACDPTVEGDRARYRFSLLSIWAGDCVAAEGPLVQLAERAAGDFNARALFWLGRCAEARKNELLAAVYRSRLIKEYPLSYHSLVLGKRRGPVSAAGAGRDLSQSSRILSALEEPKVQFRSRVRPSLNPLLQRAEALIRIREYGLASELISVLDRTDEGIEPELRLYITVLLSRVGDHLAAFRNLGLIFKQDPGKISRSSLELFYPLVRYEEIRRHGVRVDPFLTLALIRQESGFNEEARSRVGALGLMQLMPATARRIERVSKREVLDAKTNIRLGVKYFSGLLERFGGDGELALAAYNAGPERIDEWRRRYPTSDRMLFNDLIPFRETREYVSLIGRNYFWYLSLYTSSARTPASSAVLRTTQPAKPAIFTVFLAPSVK